MTNLYHVLYKPPSYKHEDMVAEYEDLAVNLYNSGRVRIDTDDKCNFARLIDHSSNINLTFSLDELKEPLITKTKEILASKYGVGSKKIDSSLITLNAQIKKLQPVSNDLAMSLIRIFVQSAHPIVIKWLIIESVEVFISYSHTIGDVLDIVSWRSAGNNSGMQSTDGRNVAIFVSCGGDPFGEMRDPEARFGDGMPAMARMQVIAGQELGHYADIKRDYSGRQIGRHSANFSCTRATENTREGRASDIKNCELILKVLVTYGLEKLKQHESKIEFYRRNKLYNLALLYSLILANFYKYRILLKVDETNLHFIKMFKDKKYMASDIFSMIADMSFNLSPQADVYKNPNPEIEEAIACVEALARIPQQVMKWGYVTTKAMMPNLYQIYYGQVIPSLIDCYNVINNTSYKRDYSKVYVPIYHRLIKFLTSILRLSKL